MSGRTGSLKYNSSYNLEWRIEKYSSIRVGKGVEVQSPEFETWPGCGKWWMLYYPEGYSKATPGYTSIFLQNNTIQPCSTTFEFSVLNKCKEKKFAVEAIQQDFTGGFGWNLVKKDALFSADNQLLDDDTLTINLKLQIEGTPASPDPNPVLTDLQNLLNTSELSDVEIRVRGTSFKVHKIILAARSTVFAAMFSHDMEENRTNVVNVADAEPEVMKAVLKYMYTGECYQLEAMCSSVLPVADKYCLEHLKKVCKSKLITQLKSENVVQFLVLAETYRLTDLKKKSIDLICRDRDKVLKSPEWERLAATNKDLVIEVLTAGFLKTGLNATNANG